MKICIGSLWHGVAVFVLVVMTGCATDSGWQTQTAPDHFVDGTVVLAEVILSANRGQVINGEGILEGWREALLAAGYQDHDINDDSEVTLWTYCYGHNSGVPLCAHHGYYLAHLPAHLQGTVRGDPDGESETNGELVEVKLKRISNGRLFGEVVNIYRKSTDWRDCEEASLQRSEAAAVLLLSLIHISEPTRRH